MPTKQVLENKARLKKQREERLARETLQFEKAKVERIPIEANIVAKNVAQAEKAHRKGVFLDAQVVRIQRELRALEKRVRDLRKANGNDNANCGDSDANGVIPGGSGNGAPRYSPKLPHNEHGVTMADVNKRLQGFRFDGSFTSSAKYRTDDGVFIHVGT